MVNHVIQRVQRFHARYVEELDVVAVHLVAELLHEVLQATDGVCLIAKQDPQVVRDLPRVIVQLHEAVLVCVQQDHVDFDVVRGSKVVAALPVAERFFQDVAVPVQMTPCSVAPLNDRGSRCTGNVVRVCHQPCVAVEMHLRATRDEVDVRILDNDPLPVIAKVLPGRGVDYFRGTDSAFGVVVEVFVVYALNLCQHHVMRPLQILQEELFRFPDVILFLVALGVRVVRAEHKMPAPIDDRISYALLHIHTLLSPFPFTSVDSTGTAADTAGGSKRSAHISAVCRSAPTAIP